MEAFMAKKILFHIDHLYTPLDQGTPAKGEQMGQIQVLNKAYIVIENNLVLATGEGESYKSFIEEDTRLVDLSGHIVTPGFVDSHTHLVYDGSRENEFYQKLQGVPYLDILAAGGGILSTVRSTRAASFEELYDKAKSSLDTMLQFGTTSLEAKSGYGLEWATEKKQLQVSKALNHTHPIDITTTFMGAHAIAPEYKNNKEEYIRLVVDEMLPKVKEENLAEFCDIFCEDGIFEVSDTRYILNKAKDLGFQIKIHADEIVSLGGAELAAETGAISAEHLMAASDQGIIAMGEQGVIANLLPATTFSLIKDTYAPARKMIEHNVAVALSSDYNPGSCPSENIQFVMQLGCMYLRMTPYEVLTATTLNGAYAIDRANSVGSLEKGKKADLVVHKAPNLEYIYYRFGVNHIKDVYKNGELVVADQIPCY